MTPATMLASIHSAWPFPIAALWTADRVPTWEEEHADAIGRATLSTIGVLRGWLLADLYASAPTSRLRVAMPAFGATADEQQVTDIITELLDAMRQLSGSMDDTVFRATNTLGSSFLLDTRLQSLREALRATARASETERTYAQRRVLETAEEVIQQLSPLLEQIETLKVEAARRTDSGLEVRWRPLTGLFSSPSFTEVYPGATAEFDPTCGLRLRCRLKPALFLTLDRPFPQMEDHPSPEAWAEVLKEWEANAPGTLDVLDGGPPPTGARHLRFPRIQANSASAASAPSSSAPAEPRAALVSTLRDRTAASTPSTEAAAQAFFNASQAHRSDPPPQAGSLTEPTQSRPPIRGCFAVMGAFFLFSVIAGIVMTLLVYDELSGESDQLERILATAQQERAATTSAPLDDKPTTASPWVDRGSDSLSVTGPWQSCPDSFVLSDGRVVARLDRPASERVVEERARSFRCGRVSGVWGFPTRAEASALALTGPPFSTVDHVWVIDRRDARRPSAIFSPSGTKPPHTGTPTAEIWLLGTPR